MMLGLAAAPASQAEAKLKLIAFTADWCAKCHVLEPALARALEQAESPAPDYIGIDLTGLKAGGEARRGLSAATQARLRIHKAGYLWDWHEGTTGLAYVIAGDTGEPLYCLTSALPAGEIAGQIALAAALVRNAPPGERSSGRPDCPGRIG